MRKKTKIRFFVMLSLPLLLLIALNNCSMGNRDLETEPTAENITPEKAGEVIETGVASWYGPDYHGKQTSSGEIYDMNKLTAAHQTLPFNTRLLVENIDNKKSVVVRINDRGPFKKERIIDLSKKAAKRLDMLDTGTANVQLRMIQTPGKKSQIPYTNPPRSTRTDTTHPKKTETNTPKENKDTSTTPPAEKKSAPIEIKRIPTDQKENPKPSEIPKPLPQLPKTQENKTPPSQVSKHTKSYIIQAGAFGVRKNAERILNKIKAALPEESTLFQIEEKTNLFKVVSTPLDSPEAASKLIKKLKDILNIEAIIR